MSIQKQSSPLYAPQRQLPKHPTTRPLFLPFPHLRRTLNRKNSNYKAYRLQLPNSQLKNQNQLSPVNVSVECGEAKYLILRKRLIRNDGFLCENEAITNRRRVRRERPAERLRVVQLKRKA